MRPNNNPLLTAATATSNQNSVAQWSENIIRASFQLVSTGTAAGTIQIEASNDQAYGLPPNQFQPTNWSSIGSPVTVTGSPAKFLVPLIELSYEYIRLTYVSTVTGVQTAVPIADTGRKQAQTVTTVADVAGSLNSTYFLVSSVNLTTKAAKDFYVWLSNGTGVDPVVAGRTAIPVTYTNDDTANTIAGNIRVAMALLTDDFTITGATNQVIVTSKAFGPVTIASNGTASPGFSYGAATLGLASNLNNTYFYLNSANGGTLYAVYMNVDAIGTAPVIAGYTSLSVPFASGSSAGTVGTALTTAVDALANFVATGTTTVTITNSASGPFVAISDTGATGFTFAVTAPTGTLTARMKSMAL